ncbi:Fe2+-dependent dioxygenase [Corticibacter populi]|uniref:Fe2+-dependent dioxygenase n=1 Tax=Corticibacter populi TaxID=1550736 RepID=A0A3M6QXX8_9BURK|nr:Fe2+-dependent dioxygenase [Corticibacter populi]RMX07854.1 Fe2+-dependent dioxygenase [Corticibacter populi]RZS35088.1 PKHD-type hydroxylase [Corticibacter populi]
MMLVISDVLNSDEVAHMRGQLEQAGWCDGRDTAGYAAVGQKSNLQLHAQDALAIALGQRILQALAENPMFVSFALPLRILPPMFNCYRGGGAYGFHIDNAIRVNRGTGERIRTDLSTTLFLSDPKGYDGGELVINGTYGAESIKLPAGHAVVYPGSSLHAVRPVTRGQRFASFFWTQSMVADDARRAILYELDTAIQHLARRLGTEEEFNRLTGVYHNLLRQWAQV